MTDKQALQCIASEVEDLRATVEDISDFIDDLKKVLFMIFPDVAEKVRELEDARLEWQLKAMKMARFPASPRPSEAQK